MLEAVPDRQHHLQMSDNTSLVLDFELLVALDIAAAAVVVEQAVAALLVLRQHSRNTLHLLAHTRCRRLSERNGQMYYDLHQIGCIQSNHMFHSSWTVFGMNVAAVERVLRCIVRTESEQRGVRCSH